MQTGGLFAMDKSSSIEVNKLTQEAEAGHGHYVGSILDQLPFEEQIHIAHQMTNLSRARIELAGLPRMELIMQSDSSDGNSGYGYSDMCLYRLTPNKFLGRLLPKSEILYESSLNLTTGEKTSVDNNR
jgi:hypothetical protein